MVHALEQIHAWLTPGGALVDIHPNGELVEFRHLQEGKDLLIGYMQESDDYIEYRQADEAIREAVTNGWFGIVQTGEFEFRTWADSFDGLKAFLDENWSDAVIDDKVAANARKLEQETGEGGIYLREMATIRLLRAL